MSLVKVEVVPDHLERLVRKPSHGLSELIWNAIDSDATTITADIEYGAFGGVEAVVVRDDGQGITQRIASEYFGRLGGSWKKNVAATDSGRTLHGQAGQGRWAAFGVGESVEWRSVASRVEGGNGLLTISGNRGHLNEFDVSAVSPTSEPTGTSVTIRQLNDVCLNWIETNDVHDFLASTFALVIAQYPIDLKWRGRKVDPAALQKDQYDEELFVDGVDGEVRLVIIEWNRSVDSRALHLCDASGSSLGQMAPGIQAPGFEFTAYLRWDGFRDLSSQIGLGDLADDPIPALITEAKSAMRRYFKRRGSERGAELVAQWKSDHSYPYADEPTTRREEAERDVFDIVAVTAAPVVERVDREARKFTLRLIREALEVNPTSLQRVLQDVLSLPQHQIDELSELLEKTSFNAMVKATRSITDRLDFLLALEHLVFANDLRKALKERSQLHRILANETWVFREEYALTADDVSLRTALREHIGILGRDDLEPHEVEEADVLDGDGRRAIVDMMLSRSIEQARNQREHVIIELKRPTVHIGEDQIRQIVKYAQAVRNDSRFDQKSTRWEFWIVGDAIADSADHYLDQDGRDPQVAWEKDGGMAVVRAVTWAQVIQDAKHRLNFVKNALEYQADDADALNYLRRKHGEYLPQPASAPDPQDGVA